MPTELKGKIIESTTEKIKNSSGIYFTNFTGMNVIQATELRKQFRDNNVEYLVTKNTLMKLAAKDAGFDGSFDEMLNGQIATAFSIDDPTSPAKVIKNFRKQHKDCLEVVGVVFEGKIFDAEKYKELADLPSKEELLAKFIGAIGQPMNQMACILNGAMSKLVGVLASLKNSKN